MKRAVLATLGLAAMLSPAFASDIPAPTRMPPVPVRAPASLPFNWAGLYAGVNLGWGFSDIDGAVGGGQVGYNWQIGQIVFGVESDLQGTGEDHGSTIVVGASVLSDTHGLDWFGTVRGRVGYAVFDRWLPYFTVGVAYGTRSFSGVAAGTPSGAYSASDTSAGWAIGLGVDYAINQWLSARFEYMHISLPGVTNVYPLAGGTLTIPYGSLDNDIFRGAVNYHILP
jgi:outer membrane immunogenic protein